MKFAILWWKRDYCNTTIRHRYLFMSSVITDDDCPEVDRIWSQLTPTILEPFVRYLGAYEDNTFYSPCYVPPPFTVAVKSET